MADQQTCELAKPETKMTATSEHFLQTRNKAKIKFPGNFASLWKGEQNVEVINCLVQSAVLYYRPHNLEMVSPLYNVRHCRFQTESCNLEDNSTIFWEADCHNTSCSGCDYEKVKDWPGEFTISTEDTPTTWLSSDRDLALTFSDNPSRVKGCDNTNLRLSDQGYAIPKESYQQMMGKLRSKRDVREDQLAAQLTAGQIHTSVQTARAIQQLFHRECRRTNRAENPTLLARKLLQKETLQARWLTERELEVWSCTEISFEHIEFRATKTCYRYIPIVVRFPEKNLRIEAFLDPVLRVISSTAAEADCLHYRFHLIEKMPKVWFRVDTKRGRMVTIPPSSIYQVYETIPDKSGGILDIKPLIFHEMVLTNSTEIFPHVDELLRFQNWKTQTSHETTSKAITLGALPYGLKGIASQLWAYYWGLIVDNWIYVACVYSTFLLFRDLIVPISCVYLCAPVCKATLHLEPKNGWPKFGKKKKKRRNRTRRNSNSSGSGQMVEMRQMLPQSQIVRYFPTSGGLSPNPMATTATTSNRMAIEGPTQMAFTVNDQMIQYAPFARNAKMRIKEVEEEDEQ